MFTVFSSTDPSEIAFAKMLLSSADIPFHIANVHTSIVEGSIGVIPQSVQISKENYETAHTILRENGLLHE